MNKYTYNYEARVEGTAIIYAENRIEADKKADVCPVIMTRKPEGADWNIAGYEVEKGE